MSRSGHYRDGIVGIVDGRKAMFARTNRDDLDSGVQPDPSTDVVRPMSFASIAVSREMIEGPAPAPPVRPRVSDEQLDGWVNDRGTFWATLGDFHNVCADLVDARAEVRHLREATHEA